VTDENSNQINPDEDQEPTEQQPAELVSFSTLDLPSPVMNGVHDANFTTMTPVQAASLPIAISGKDLCAQAQTGTGKTATFLISLFTQILDREIPKKRKGPLALVLAPTRELAVQIHKEGEMLGKHTGLTQLAVYGGEGFKRQEDGLRKRPHIVVGTPGRLIDFARRRVLDLSEVRFLVIDEADRLLDLGFWDELRDILRRLPAAKNRQSMLFSATLDRRTRSIAREFMNRPRDVSIAPEQITAEGIDQAVYHVDRDDKFKLLLGILGKEEITKGLIFTNMKITAAWLVKKLKEHGYNDIGLLTGDLRQSLRNRVLERFKGNKLPLLVASDVASRGLHIDDVTHIINYDVPQDPEDYVHRIGRTARAGKRGKAYTLACDQYVYTLPAIEELLNDPIPSIVPYDEDYGEDKSPEYTVDRMMDEQRREKRKQRQAPRSRGRRPDQKRGRKPGGRKPGKQRR
jgi:ATP-dependent RNA helicase RhlB